MHVLGVRTRSAFVRYERVGQPLSACKGRIISVHTACVLRDLLHIQSISAGIVGNKQAHGDTLGLVSADANHLSACHLEYVILISELARLHGRSVRGTNPARGALPAHARQEACLPPWYSLQREERFSVPH